MEAGIAVNTDLSHNELAEAQKYSENNRTDSKDTHNHNKNKGEEIA